MRSVSEAKKNAINSEFNIDYLRIHLSNSTSEYSNLPIQSSKHGRNRELKTEGKGVSERDFEKWKMK